MVRRHRYDPLATSDKPRWIKHFDQQLKELSTLRLEPHVDLRRAIQEEAARCSADGWNVEHSTEFLNGTFFMNRRSERRLVLITPAEHSGPAPGIKGMSC
jgi:hypothetical protein